MPVSDEIKAIIYLSISHYLVITASIYLYCIGTNQLYFTSEAFYGIHKYSLIFIILYIFIPTILLILIPNYKNRIKVINIILYICFFLIFFSFILGLLLNISVWKMYAEAESFVAYCPYHFIHSLLNSIMDKQDYNQKEFCETRKCILYSEDEEDSLAYRYICNYNSLIDLKKKNNDAIYKRTNSNGNEISSNIFIHCSKTINIIASDPTLIKYYNLCKKDSYYLCQLFEKPNEQDYTSVNNKESCPTSNYVKTSVLFGISFLLIDLICFCFLYFAEFLILKKIKNLIQYNESRDEKKENQETINSTIKKDNQQNNNDNNNNEEFKKEPTLTLIVGGVPQSDEIIISTPKKEDDNFITNIVQKEGIHIQNLKTASNTKLLNINFCNKQTNNNNEINNDKNLEIRPNRYFDRNKNKRIKFNIQDTFVQSSTKSTNLLQSNKDKEANPITIFSIHKDENKIQNLKNKSDINDIYEVNEREINDYYEEQNQIIDIENQKNQK